MSDYQNTSIFQNVFEFSVNDNDVRAIKSGFVWNVYVKSGDAYIHSGTTGAKSTDTPRKVWNRFRGV